MTSISTPTPSLSFPRTPTPQHHQTTIGAFISEPLKAPSKRIMGNGETFLFTLDSSRKVGRAKKYPWVKSKYRKSSSDLYNVEVLDLAATDVPLEGTFIQFAVFSPASITFGASGEHGTNAIRMDSELSRCHCGPSDTFGNSKYNILTGQVEGRRLEESFQIESVELYCDRRSMGH
jgi:TLD